MDKDVYVFDLYGTLVDIRTDEDDPGLWRAMAAEYAAECAAYGADELRAAYDRLVQDEIDVLWARCREELSGRVLLKGEEDRGDESNLDCRENSGECSGLDCWESFGAGGRLDCREKPGEWDGLDLRHLPREYVEPSLRRVFERLFEVKGVAVGPDVVSRIGWRFREISTRKLRLYEGAAEVLAELGRRGHRVYLLSNAQDVFTRPELEKLGISGAFQGIILSSEVGVKKPARQIFELLCRRFDVDPARAVMVGNDPVCDMAAAAEAGMHGVYIHTEQSPAGPVRLPRGCRQIRRIGELTGE